MERAEISRIAHRDHPIAAPLGAARVAKLLSRLQPPGGGRALDLGCGWGEWLLTLLQLRRDIAGVGVDLHLPPETASGTVRYGVTDRVRWEQADVAGWSDGPFDVVICVGVSHAFGGLDRTLRVLRQHLAPGGQVVLGDAIWEVSPSLAAQRALEAGPGDFPGLPGFLAQVREHDFEPSFGHLSTIEEWDDYEWSWTGSLTAWALRESPTEQDRHEALEVARRHRDGWIGGYRGQLGFATLILNDIAGAG